MKNIQAYRPKEVSKILSCGISTVWLYIKQGKLKSQKLSNRVTIIKHEDLESFINSRGA